MNTSSVPAPTPGSASGQYTRQNACTGAAPSEEAARRYCGWMERITEYSGSTMNGSSTPTSSSAARRGGAWAMR